MGGLGGRTRGVGGGRLRSSLHDMRMVWTDRNRVWRKVEVALVEQQSGEIREGLAGGRGVWRVRAQSLVEAVEEWLASNAAATDQAVRDLEGGGGGGGSHRPPYETPVRK